MYEYHSLVKKKDETLDGKFGDGGARWTPGDLESMFLLYMESTCSDIQGANGISTSDLHRATVVLEHTVRR